MLRSLLARRRVMLFTSLATAAARAALAGVLAGFCLIQAAAAIDFTWTGPDGQWEDPGSWDNSGIPDDTGDTATIGGSISAELNPILTSNVNVGAVTINGSAHLDLMGRQLLVQQAAHSGTVTLASDLTVRQSTSTFDLDTDFLVVNLNGDLFVREGSIAQVDFGATINDGGQIQLFDNSVFEAGGALDNNFGGDIVGAGTVQVTGSDPFSNDGSIRASGGTLVIDMSGTGSFDWDGDGDSGGGAGDTGALLEALNNSTLQINSIGDTLYNGVIELNSNSTLDTSGLSWSLASSPTIDTGILNKDGMGTGTVIAANLLLVGSETQVNVNSGALVFDTPVDDNGAVTTVASGATLQFNEAFDANSAASVTDDLISVAGTVIFNGPTTINAEANLSGASGELIVNGATTIDQTTWNWDGFLTTTVNDGATLTINSTSIDTAADGFDGTLFINGGTVDVNNPWEFETATLNMDTSNGAALLSGSAMTINSNSATINVTGTGAGDADITAPLIIDAGVDVNIDAGTTLDLGTNTINSASTTWDGGAGSVLSNGVATINAITTYNLPGGHVNLDDGSDTLNAQLTINADSIDDAGDGYDGTMVIDNSGALIVNLTGNAEWSAETATITYNGDATVGTIIGGSSPVRFSSGSTLNVNGVGALTTVAAFAGTGVVNVLAAGDELRLADGNLTTTPNRIEGGTINGPGEIAANAGRALHGFGDVNADIDFDGSASLRADDGTLNVAGSIVDLGTLGTADADGQLNMVNAWSTANIDVVELRGGELTGAAGNNAIGKTIRGFGTITSANISNNGEIAGDGGVLVLDFGANPDLDGGSANGIVSAVTGDIRVVDPVTDDHDGTVNIGANRFIAFDGGWTLSAAGTLNLNGGPALGSAARIEGGQQQLSGAVNVDANARLNAPTEFTATANVALPDANDALALGADAVIRAGAVFDDGAGGAGSGRLVNLPGSTLTIESNAPGDLDVLLANRGNLVIGTSPGLVQGRDFEQTAAGSLAIEIMGTALADFDRLTMTGAATLAGELDLDLIGGFVPTLGDTFNFFGSSFGFTGGFDVISQPATMPFGLEFAVNDLGTLLQLEVVAGVTYTADFDMDGDVDAADLAQWEGDFGLNGDSDANSDGMSTGADFLAWQRQLGSGLPPTVAAVGAVPEPATVGLTLMACLGIGGLRARSRRAR